MTYNQLVSLLDRENFERRALGRTDYPSDFPLKEVLLIARHCSGGVILGFSQFQNGSGTWKPWEIDNLEKNTVDDLRLPTPWNQLEAGILFAMRLPLMVFKEEGISGGVFDNGVTDVFTQKLPVGGFSKDEKVQVIASIQNWASLVRQHYRAWD
ncbi:MAG: hypothetical protein AAGF71_14960 [Pseudomonadota bacterium]